MTARLRLKDITTTYPGVRANDGISLEVDPGKVLAVLGENGAGKSTLMKIIYGAVQPDSGTIEFDGTPVVIHSPGEARTLGIAMVHQHFALFETLTVAQNVLYGRAAARGNHPGADDGTETFDSRRTDVRFDAPGRKASLHDLEAACGRRALHHLYFS